jgi:hypothetical protein
MRREHRELAHELRSRGALARIDREPALEVRREVVEARPARRRDGHLRAAIERLSIERADLRHVGRVEREAQREREREDVRGRPDVGRGRGPARRELGREVLR